MAQRDPTPNTSTNPGPRTLTPAERRALVLKPFPLVHIVTRSYPWGGVQIVRELPTEGRRKPAGRAYDESGLTVNIEDLIAITEG